MSGRAWGDDAPQSPKRLFLSAASGKALFPHSFVVAHRITLGAKLRLELTVINTDAHHTGHIEKIKYGILQARRAWLTKSDVLNTLPVEQFAKAMARG